MNDRMATLPAKRADWPASRWLAVCGVLSAASIAAALLTQHRFGMEPCSWCVLQRAIFALIGLIALLGLVARTRWAHRAAALLVACLCACGLAAASWQYFVASHSESCNLTLADRLLTGARLVEWLPDVFEARASCADAAVDLLGVPYVAWAALLFIVCGVAAALAFIRSVRR